jgi:hypothetical protein
MCQFQQVGHGLEEVGCLVVGKDGEREAAAPCRTGVPYQAPQVKVQLRLPW